MLTHILSGRILVATLVGLGLTSTAMAEPISFQAALDAAEHAAPTLAARTAATDAARSAAIPAGELPDPKLFFGVDNLPATGTDRWRLNRDFMTMQKIGLMQELPNAGKRQANIDVANAALAKAQAERRAVLFSVRSEAAQAWIARYYLEQKIGLFDELSRENRLLVDTVKAQWAAGRGMPADAVMPRQEASMLDERRDELARDLATAKSRLKRWTGLPADAPLAGDAPHFAVESGTLHHGLAQHPDLAALEPMAAMAQAEVRQADAARHPDWTVELAYQRRAPQYGDMISIQFSLDLPIFQSSRQLPTLAAKQAELQRLDADSDAMRAEHAQQLEAQLAEYARLDRALTRQHTELLPLAQEKLDLLSAGYRAGRADLGLVLSARRELIEQRLRTIDLDSQRAVLAAQLHFANGDEH